MPDGAGGTALVPARAWMAMGAVALALGLIWLAPGLGDPHVDEAGSAEFSGRSR